MNRLTFDELTEYLSYSPVTGVLTWKKNRRADLVGLEAGGVCRYLGYRRIRVKGKQFYAHHLAWLYFYREWPEAEIDHRDGNKANNAIKNLRLATRSQQVANSYRKKNKSGYRGVYWSSRDQLWYAQIRIGGRTSTIASGKSPKAVAEIRQKRAIEIYGEYEFETSRGK